MNEPFQNLSKKFVHDLKCLGINAGDEDLNRARECLFDYLGVVIAGSRDLKLQHLELLKRLSADHGDFHVIGLSVKTNLLTAALLNGMSAHYLELDDGHRYGMVHPGATVISALLPLAFSIGARDEVILRAIIVGYEAAIVLSKAVQPSMKHRGYHATGTCGAVGAAMGASFLLDQTEKNMQTTLCVAATQAAGLLQVIRDGSNLKPFNAGQAALHGVLAATIGCIGYEGPLDVLGGEQGLLNVLSDAPKLETLNEVGRQPPAINGIYVKPYAACRHCHPAIEAALALRNHAKFNVNSIASIEVQTYSLAVMLHDHNNVQNSSDARMSTPYGVASAIYFGAADIEQFEPEAMNDLNLLDLISKVRVIEDPEFTAQVPKERAARVLIYTNQGEKLEHTIKLPRGEPETKLIYTERLNKFIKLTTYADLSSQRIDAIIDCVAHAGSPIMDLNSIL
jgi:2-methylcitrate dehydratase PrpD